MGRLVFERKSILSANWHVVRNFRSFDLSVNPFEILLNHFKGVDKVLQFLLAAGVAPDNGNHIETGGSIEHFFRFEKRCRCPGKFSLFYKSDRFSRFAMIEPGSRPDFHKNNRMTILKDQVDLAESVANVLRQELHSQALQVLPGKPLPLLPKRFRSVSTELERTPPLQRTPNINCSSPE